MHNPLNSIQINGNQVETLVLATEKFIILVHEFISQVVYKALSVYLIYNRSYSIESLNFAFKRETANARQRKKVNRRQGVIVIIDV